MSRVGMFAHRWLAGVLLVAVAAGMLVVQASVRGVSAEPSCNDPGSALPVVVVHGFRSSAAEMAGLVAILEDTQIEVAVETFDYGARSLSWVTDDQIGPKLRQRLICLADASLAASGPGRVAVVGHSMGGLATRQALASDPGDGRGQLIDEIALVATIGTPHEGSVFAGPAVDENSSEFALAVRQAYEWTSWAVPKIPSVRNEAGRALAVGSQQLGGLSAFPDDVPVLALAGEFVGQPRFLFYHSSELRIGDSVVSRPSAWAHSHQIDQIGGVDGIECHIDLPLELAGLSLASAIWAEWHANPGFLDCGHTALPDAERVTTEINIHLAAAANRPPRTLSQLQVANAFYEAFLDGDAERARRFTLPGQDPDSYQVLVRDRPSAEFLADDVWSCWDLYCDFMDNVTPGWKLVVEPRDGRYVVTGVLHDVGHPVADWPEEELTEYCVIDSTPLNLRSGPGIDHPAMTAIPVDACGVYGYDEMRDVRWRPVQWQGRLGFVADSMLRPASDSAVAQPDLPSAPSIVADFMAAWWSQDRATLEKLAEASALDSFEPTPEGLASYHINDDGRCSLGTSGEGACTVTLIVPEGGGFTWMLAYREVDRGGNVIIYHVEPFGGGM